MRLRPVTLALLVSITVAAQTSPSTLSIRSTNLPADECAAIESRFTCTACTPEQVEETVRNQVRALGYFKAVVNTLVSAPPITGNTPVLLYTVSVNAGPRYTMGTLDFTGATLFPANQLRKVVLLRPGMVFSSPLLSQSLEALRNFYAHAGHNNAVISPVVRIDEVRRIIHVILNIDKG